MMAAMIRPAKNLPLRPGYTRIVKLQLGGSEDHWMFACVHDGKGYLFFVETADLKAQELGAWLAVLMEVKEK